MDNEICCPPFDPKPWENKVFNWENKLFVKDRVLTLFFMPINFGSVMKKVDKKIRDSQGTIVDNMGLSDHTSKWNMAIYLAVDKEVPGLENVTLNGKFFSHVYEGPFKDTEKWCKDFEAMAKSKNMTIKKWYMWYTTCPKCAKKYGKNYVVIIAQVE